ncbi:MAG: DUF1801 domain-containing protein [Planctomycetes bacterium]|nr:DUF1801 domain-containing protein [Planctomycetota bacterium]
MVADNRSSVQAYLQKLPPQARFSLERLCRAIRAAAPKATEGTSYGLPAFLLDGPLVAIAAHKSHCAFYPMSPAVIDAHKKQLEGYDLSKGTIRFPIGTALPDALVRKLVKARIAERTSKVTKRAPRKGTT